MDSCADPGYDPKLQTTVEAYCDADNKIAAKYKKCAAGAECCAGGTCAPNTGKLNLTLNECPCGDAGRYVSNGSEKSPKAFSGTASVAGTAVLPPSCQIHVYVKRPGAASAAVLKSCPKGASSCGFSFAMQPGEYDKNTQPSYTVSALAVDCCLPPESAKAFAHLDLAKISMPDYAYTEGGSGCYWNDLYHIPVSYFPSCLKPTGGSIDAKHSFGPVRAVKTDPMQWAVEVTGSAVTAKLLKAWWYGYPTPLNSTKANLCYNNINRFNLTANVSFEQCGLTVTNDKVKAYVKMPTSAGTVYKTYDFINFERNLSEQLYTDADKVCCRQTFNPTLPTSEIVNTLTVDTRTQFARYACEEEYFHVKQECGEVGWSQGGMNINRPGRFAELAGLTAAACAVPQAGETKEQAGGRACSTAMLTLSPVVIERWSAIVQRYDISLRNSACWVEYTAKKAIGQLHDTVAGYHFECTYGAFCPGVQYPPAQP